MAFSEERLRELQRELSRAQKIQTIRGIKKTLFATGGATPEAENLRKQLLKSSENKVDRIKLERGDKINVSPRNVELFIRKTNPTKEQAEKLRGAARFVKQESGKGGKRVVFARNRLQAIAAGVTPREFFQQSERDREQAKEQRIRSAGLAAQGAAETAQGLSEKQKREFARANPEIAQAVSQGRQPRPTTRREELEQESAGVQGIEEREKRQLTRDLLEARSPQEARQLLAAQRQREELRQRFAEARAAQPNVFDTTIDRAAQVIDDSERAVKKLDEEVIGKGSRLQGPPAPPKAGDTFVIGSTAVATPEDKTTGKFTTPFLAGQVAPQQQQSTGRTISPKGGDPLAQATKQLEKTGKESDNPLVAFPAGFGTEFGNFASFLVDIERKGGQKFVELVKGERQPAPKPLPIPETATGQFVSGPVEGVAKAIETGDVSQIGVESRKGAEKAAESFQKNPAFSAGALAAFLLPLSPKAVKLVPLRLTPTKVVTGTKTVTQKVKGKLKEKQVQQQETLFRELSLGFGGKKTKPLLTKVGKDLVKGKPKPEEVVPQLRKLKPPERGFEITTGTRAEQRFFTDQKTLQPLAKQGIVTQRTPQVIKELETIVKESRKIKATPKREEITGKVVRSLEPGEETKSIVGSVGKEQFKLIGKTGKLKGGLAERFFQREAEQLVTSDIDQDVRSFAKAIKVVGEVQKKGVPARGGRAFEVKVREKTKSAAVEVVEGGKREKVFEALSPEQAKAELGASQIAKGDPFGVKRPKKTFKVKVEGEKIKVADPRSQIEDLAASIGSLQKKGTKFDVGPFAPREVKEVSKLVINVRGLAETGLKSGSARQEKAARKALAASQRLEKLFPDINVQSFIKARQGGLTTVEPSTPSALSQAAKSPSAQSQAAAAGIEVSQVSPIETRKDDLLKDFVPTQAKKSRVSKTGKKEPEISVRIPESTGAQKNIPRGTSAALPESPFSFSAGKIVRSDLPIIGPRGKSPSTGRSKRQKPEINISIPSPKSKPKKDEPSFIPTSPAGPSRDSPPVGSPGSPFVGSPGPSPGSGLVRSPPRPPRGGFSGSGTLPGSGLIAPPGTRKKAGLIFLLPDGKPKDRINLGPSERIFAVGSSDPFRPGVIFTAGVPEFQVSKSPDLFEKIDIQLGKARKKKGAEKPEFPDVVDIGGRGAVGALQPRAAKRTRKKPRRSAIGRQAARVRTSKRTKRKVTGKRKKSSKHSRQ